MGFFEWVGNTMTKAANERNEAYERVRNANWESVYNLLKKENALSAKSQGFMRALGEKLKEEDTDRLRQFYENEVRNSAEKRNPTGFVVLKKEMERRGIH